MLKEERQTIVHRPRWATARRAAERSHFIGAPLSMPRLIQTPAAFANDTSNTATGSEKPLRKSGGSGLTFTSLLSSTLTALDTRICPTEALEQNRAAMFTTLPIAV